MKMMKRAFFVFTGFIILGLEAGNHEENLSGCDALNPVLGKTTKKRTYKTISKETPATPPPGQATRANHPACCLVLLKNTNMPKPATTGIIHSSRFCFFNLA